MKFNHVLGWAALCAPVASGQPPRPAPRVALERSPPAAVVPAAARQPAPAPLPPAGLPEPRPQPAARPGPARDQYPIDLPTALRLADAQNPTVGVARARVREALARADQASVLWLPNLTAGTSAFFHDGIDQNRRADVFNVTRGNLFLGGGPQFRFDLADALYLPLITRRLSEAEAARARAAANDIQLDVTLAYFDLVEQAALAAINADTLARAEQVLRSAEAGAAAGLNKTAADVNRAATEVNLRRQEGVVLRGRAAAASARLARLLLLDPAVELTPFELAVVPVVVVPPGCRLEELIAAGLRARPEVAAAAADLAAAQAGVTQARKAPLLPRVQGEAIGGGFSPGKNDSYDPLRGQVNVTVSAVWELRNLGLGNMAEIRARQARFDQSVFRAAEIEARVKSEVVEAAELAAARFDALPPAQEAVRQALEMYRKFREGSFGMVGPRAQFDALEPLTAVQALNAARVQYLQQVVEFNRAQFRLYTAMGQPAESGLGTATAAPVDVPAVPAPDPKRP